LQGRDFCARGTTLLLPPEVGALFQGTEYTPVRITVDETGQAYSADYCLSVGSSGAIFGGADISAYTVPDSLSVR